MWNETVIKMIGVGILETLYMTFMSSFVAYLIGLPLGVILVITDKEGIAPNVFVNKVLGVIVNLVRSIPFVILLISIMPFTRWIVGTTIGAKAVIPALIFAAAPYIARLVNPLLRKWIKE